MSDGRPTEAAAAAFEPGGVVRGVLARSRVLNPGGGVVLRLLIRLLWIVTAGGWGCPPDWRQSDQENFGLYARLGVAAAGGKGEGKHLIHLCLLCAGGAAAPCGRLFSLRRE